jgi:hypothetical protein
VPDQTPEEVIAAVYATAHVRVLNDPGMLARAVTASLRANGWEVVAAARPSHGTYPVYLCGSCHHPGGQHIAGEGCRLCRDCPGWDEGRMKRGMWSDRMTDELLAAISEATTPAETITDNEGASS